MIVVADIWKYMKHTINICTLQYTSYLQSSNTSLEKHAVFLGDFWRSEKPPNFCRKQGKPWVAGALGMLQSIWLSHGWMQDEAQFFSPEN